jgi:hypothetical protein
MIEIEILLTFVYFLECTVVQCKDALSIIATVKAIDSEWNIMTGLFGLGLNLQKIGCAVIWNYFRLLMLKVVPDISRPKKSRHYFDALYEHGIGR